MLHVALTKEMQLS